MEDESGKNWKSRKTRSWVPNITLTKELGPRSASKKSYIPKHSLKKKLKFSKKITENRSIEREPKIKSRLLSPFAALRGDSWVFVPFSRSFYSLFVVCSGFWGALRSFFAMWARFLAICVLLMVAETKVRGRRLGGAWSGGPKIITSCTYKLGRGAVLPCIWKIITAFT